jgi:branched-chain amino acid transport system ATP-binding protein
MASKSPLLRASALTRRFGGLAAVDQVTLDVHLGEIHAVIGTNGAGKSTLVNMLSGELPPSSGALHMNGVDITGWTQARRARAGIGRSYQRTTIFPSFSLMENCRLAAQAHAQRAWRIWEGAKTCSTSNAAALRALQAAGLHDRAETLAGAVSHGQQRQLEVAMCLATQPTVLLLDEPLAGMGAEESERMLSLLESLRATHAIVLVEHDMDAVFRVADRVTVMVNGQVIASDRPDAIRTNAAVRTAYLGEHDAEH